MANFNLYSPKLKQFEGGFVNHPNDGGGATNMGVTLYTYKRFFGENKTVDDLKKMTLQEWHIIMKQGYWDKCMADKIYNQSVAEMLVDWYINSGNVAIKILQKLIQVRQDGIFGVMTLNALNVQYPQKIFEDLKEERRQFYYRLVEKNPSQKVFLKGWLRRVDSFNF